MVPNMRKSFTRAFCGVLIMGSWCLQAWMALHCLFSISWSTSFSLLKCVFAANQGEKEAEPEKK